MARSECLNRHIGNRARSTCNGIHDAMTCDHMPRLSRTRATSSSDLRQDARDDRVDAGGGRMQAVALIELGLGGDAVEEERIEQQVVFWPRARDRSPRSRAHSRRRDWAPPACRRAARRCARAFSRRTISSSASRVTFGSMPAQHVVGAELEDHGVGALRHRPVEPGEPAERGVAGDAGIDDLDREALGLERLLELGREGRAGGQAEPAVSESPSATIRTGRSAAPAAGARHSERQQPPRPAANAWTSAGQPPYDRGSPTPGSTAGITERPQHARHLAVWAHRPGDRAQPASICRSGAARRAFISSKTSTCI